MMLLFCYVQFPTIELLFWVIGLSILLILLTFIYFEMKKEEDF